MKLNSKVLLGALTAALFTVSACDKKEEKKEEKAEEKAEAKAEEPPAEAKEEEPPAEEEAKEEAAAEGEGEDGGGGADKIGVPECDEYITKYLKCIEEKMPEAAREQTRKAVQQSIDAWKQAAEGPGKDTLAQTCKTALETAKKATEAMGCEW